MSEIEEKDSPFEGRGEMSSAKQGLPPKVPSFDLHLVTGSHVARGQDNQHQQSREESKTEWKANYLRSDRRCSDLDGQSPVHDNTPLPGVQPDHSNIQ